ncbi:hypothetical protein, partial [Nocardia wallacei]|uniref:hypothetical protein n=1 Tax=Nocardia wallacei TaxID=480035 RepID=UPI002453754E
MIPNYRPIKGLLPLSFIVGAAGQDSGDEGQGYSDYRPGPGNAPTPQGYKIRPRAQKKDKDN